MGEAVGQGQVAGREMRNTGSVLSWAILGPIGLGVALISLIFSRELKSAIEIWDASTAYSHCYLVLPMVLYLLWERRDVLMCGKAKPEGWAVLAALPLTLLWLVAERLGIMEARQLAVISGFELLFFSVVGRRVFSMLSGPLLFLFFLVPFGAFLTPSLQQFTATFSTLGLNLLGIPNFSDGFTIETPAGIFFVAEACAGLRFLIAAISFGVFYALLNFSSFTRRTAFIAASIVVPVVANGFRALGIIVLGQVLGSAQAAAADHLVYGWIFFSFVMLCLIAGGHAFREVRPVLVNAADSISAAPMRSPIWPAACVVLILGIGPALASAIGLNSTAPVLPETVAIIAPSGCSITKDERGAAPNRHRSTIICDGTQFDVSVTAFPARSTSSEMIVERRRVTQEIGAENSTIWVVETPNSAGRWTMVQTTDPDRLTGYAGWVDGMRVSSSMAGRIAQARDSVFGTSFWPALVTITTAEPANSLPGNRNNVLEKLKLVLAAQGDLNSRMAAMTRLKGD